MDLHGKFFIKHKFWEIEFIREKEYWQWFQLNINFNRKTDHAGLHVIFEILGYVINFDIYDHRHWNFETDSWEKCDCV